MKWRIAGSVALLVAALTSVGGAQQEYQPDPLYKLDPQSRKQVQLLIDSARLADLPWNAVRLKAIQGVNLKVDNKKVVAVVREYFKTLVQSKGLLGPLASTDDIEAGASVLTTSVRPDELALFRVSVAGRSPTRALVYLADLIGKRNVPREDAVAALARLWKDGAAEADFDGLWHGIDHDILSGVSPKAALQNQVRSLPPRLSKPPAEQDEENPHS